MKKLLLSTILLLAFTITKAQVIPQNIVDRINNSEYIFEGKVIRSNTYFTRDHRMIYTSSTIDIYKVFKGNLNCGTVEVLTRGGCVGDMCLTITDNLVLKKEMVGIFMCSPTNKELSLVDYYPESNSVVLDFPYDIQGYIKYFDDDFNKAIVDYQYSLDSLAEAYNLMQLYTQLNYIDCHAPSPVVGHHSLDSYTHVADSNETNFLSAMSAFDTTMTYTLMNPQITGTSTKYFEFDIGLSDNMDSIYFVSASIKIRCDSTIFGSMLKQHNKVWVNNIGPLTDTVNSYKPASVLDYQRENIWVLLVQRNPGTFSTNFVPLSSTPTPCIHVKIEIMDCTHTGYLTQILGNWPYLYPQYSLSPSAGPLPSYQTFDYSSSAYFQGCGNVQLLSINPDTVAGGVSDTVTIRGTNFGARGANSQIFVRNADDGGHTYITLNYFDIFEWTDSTIKFVMPGIVDSLTTTNSGFGIPGSGPIKIQTSSLDSATGSIQVLYSLISKIDTLSPFQKANVTPYDYSPNGTRDGIVFYYDSSFYNHPERMICTNKAMKDWTCMSQINFSVRGNLIDTLILAENDSMNFIKFGQTPIGKLAETSLWSNLTPGCAKPLWKVDMVFKDSMAPYLFCDTNSCDSLPYNLVDLYAVALHEFGHVHGLNHVNDRNAIMWFGTTPGVNPYTVSSDRQIWINYDPSAYVGSLKVMTNSQDPGMFNCLGSGKAFTPLVLSDCEFIHRQMYSSDCHSVIGIDEVNFGSSVNLFPNPVSNSLSIDLKEGFDKELSIQIFDLAGRNVMSPVKLKNGVTHSEIDVSLLTAGVYFIKFNSSVSRLIVKN